MRYIPTCIRGIKDDTEAMADGGSAFVGDGGTACMRSGSRIGDGGTQVITSTDHV